MGGWIFFIKDSKGKILLLKNEWLMIIDSMIK